MSSLVPNQFGRFYQSPGGKYGDTPIYNRTLGYTPGLAVEQAEEQRTDVMESEEKNGIFGGLSGFTKRIGNRLEQGFGDLVDSYIIDKFPEQSEVLRRPTEVRSAQVDLETGEAFKLRQIPGHYVLIGAAALGALLFFARR